MIDENESRGGRATSNWITWLSSSGLRTLIGVLVVSICAALVIVSSNQRGIMAKSYRNTETEQPTINGISLNEDNICTDLQHCCVIRLDCPMCSAPKVAEEKQRVRRNILILSYEEIKKVTDAFWVMKLTPMEEGKSLYGSFFKTYDYFVVKHFTATQDTRGDQAHFMPALITWHGLFELEFEMSLLSIDPSIEALPYWNWNQTLDSSSIFNSELFGTTPGTGENFQVIDGLFAYWPIGKMDRQIYMDLYFKYLTNSSLNLFNGDTESGYLRGSPTATPLLTRYGTNINFPIDRDCAKTSSFPFSELYGCFDVHSNPVFHGTPHDGLGGRWYDADSGLIWDGDFYNGHSSPNEPMFHFHHPNLDRVKMAWMQEHAETASQFYGYPTKGSPVDIANHLYFDQETPGGGLNDIVSWSFGFTDADVGIDAHRQADTPAGKFDRTVLWTHADAICYLQPDTAPYRYDTLLNM